MDRLRIMIACSGYYRLSVCGRLVERITLLTFPKLKGLPLFHDQHCGGWYTYGNGRWTLESCADCPKNCICAKLRESPVDLPFALSWSYQHSEPSTSRESQKRLIAAEVERKLEEVSALSQQLRNKQAELDALKDKLHGLEETAQTRTNNVPVLRSTTPSWLLARSVKLMSTLKTITEDQESEFSQEFSRHLPKLTPLSLVRRELAGRVFDATEATAVVSPFSYQALSQSVSSSDNEPVSSSATLASSSNVNNQEVVDTLSKQLRNKQLELAILEDKLEQDEGEATTSRRRDLSVVPLPQPTTPSWLLVKSVKQMSTLQTITEDQVSDFSKEFSWPLTRNRYTPLFLTRREQAGRLFKGYEATVVVSPYAYPTLSQGKCSSIGEPVSSSDTTSVCSSSNGNQEKMNALSEQLKNKQLPVAPPITPSWLLARSVKQISTLKTITEGEECNFLKEFFQPLPQYTPLTLVRREQAGRYFHPTEATAVVSPSTSGLLEARFTRNNEQVSTSNNAASIFSSSSDEGQTSIKIDFPLLINPLPTTASHHLALSVKKHTNLRTVAEDEVCDFAEDFNNSLPTFTQHSLISREQRGEVFTPKESTAAVSSFSFLQETRLDEKEGEKQQSASTEKDIKELNQTQFEKICEEVAAAGIGLPCWADREVEEVKSKTQCDCNECRLAAGLYPLLYAPSHCNQMTAPQPKCPHASNDDKKSTFDKNTSNDSEKSVQQSTFNTDFNIKEPGLPNRRPPSKLMWKVVSDDPKANKHSIHKLWRSRSRGANKDTVAFWLEPSSSNIASSASSSRAAPAVNSTLKQGRCVQSSNSHIQQIPPRNGQRRGARNLRSRRHNDFHGKNNFHSDVPKHSSIELLPQRGTTKPLKQRVARGRRSKAYEGCNHRDGPSRSNADMLSEKSISKQMMKGGQGYRGRGKGRGSSRSRGYNGISGEVPRTRMHTEIPSRMDTHNQTNQRGRVGRGRVSRPWVQN